MLFFRVYDPETKKIVQKNVGHTDSVRSIIHIPERSQVRTSANLTSIRSNVFRWTRNLLKLQSRLRLELLASWRHGGHVGVPN